MTLRGPGTRLTIMLGEFDQTHHRPVYIDIVHRAYRAGLAGASVFRGIEGFGKSKHIHTTRLLSLSEDLPVAVVIVDTDERIRAFFLEYEELEIEGLVILEPVEVIRYASRRPAGRDEIQL